MSYDSDSSGVITTYQGNTYTYGPYTGTGSNSASWYPSDSTYTIEPTNMVILDELKRTRQLIMGMFGLIASLYEEKECENGGDCGRCIACSMKEAMEQFASEMIKAIA